MPNVSSNGDLLEPFRARRQKCVITSREELQVGVNRCLTTISRGLTMMTKTREQSSQVNFLNTTTKDRVKDDSLNERNRLILSTEESKMNELSDHQQRVVRLVHDDEMFRNLQSEMRKNARTGCGSHQVIQKLVKKVSSLEESPGLEINDYRFSMTCVEEEATNIIEEEQKSRIEDINLVKRRSQEGLRLRLSIPPCA